MIVYLVRWDAQYDEYLYYYIRFNLAPAPTPSAPLWQEGLVYVWSMLSQDAAAKLFFCFWFWGKVVLENFISLVGPGDQQLICFYAPVQFGFAAPRACGAWQTLSLVGIHARPMSTRCQYIESYIFSLPGKVVQSFAMVKIPVRCAQRTSTVIFSFSLFLFSFPLHSAAPTIHSIDILTLRVVLTVR